MYPAVFTPDRGAYSVVFPDLSNCYTCGDDLIDGCERRDVIIGRAGGTYNLTLDARSIQLTDVNRRP